MNNNNVSKHIEYTNYCCKLYPYTSDNKYYGLLVVAIYFAQAFFIEKHGLRYHIAIIYTD